MIKNLTYQFLKLARICNAYPVKPDALYSLAFKDPRLRGNDNQMSGLVLAETGKIWNSAHTYCIQFFTAVLLLIHFQANAQVSLPLNREIIQRLEPEILRQTPDFFTSLKPYDEWQLRKSINVDSLLSFNRNNKHSSWFGRKLFEESLLQVDSQAYSLKIDPVFDFSLGKEAGNSQNLIGNTRGFLIRCRIGKAIGIESSFYENQVFFPKVWDQFINKYRVAPGQSRAKRYHSTGWDFAYATGSITWKPKGVFSLQLGQGKNFIGDGYRSLLLSDVSSTYPFVKFSLTWKKFQYTRIMASLQNLDYLIINKDTKEFPQKIANFHLLSFNTFKNLQVSLFEGIILNNPDPSGKFSLNFDVVNPIPFIDVLYRNSSNETKINSVGGINLSWHISPHLQLYNQWSFDDPIHKEFDGNNGINQYGSQVGLKYFDAFKVKNLYFQSEFNLVQPFTYSQGDSVISYSHFDQPLAHPLGANFYEFTEIANYRFKRLYAEYILTYANYGTDNNTGLSGKDILRPHTQFSNTFLQGIKTTLVTHQARLAWYLNPATNSCISFGVYWQSQKSALNNISTKMFYVSFSTNLRNLYYDF